MQPIKSPKKLIEVALPLDDINAACAYEKMPGIGAHPRGIHLWWARRPLAAARAVIFAQMVNDPGGNRGYGPGKTKAQALLERERLFDILRGLVKWENTNNSELLEKANEEIWKSWRETCDLNRSHPQATELFNPDKLPAFHDPFAGGGAIPLEAQRLGMVSNASDLNPVAVLINKSMIEIPPRFFGRAPVGPETNKNRQGRLSDDWTGVKGLAEDVRRYAQWIKDETILKIGHYYPKAKLPKEYGGTDSNVIAWLWARTVKSPNPAYSHVEVPLIASFILANKSGREFYIEPIVEDDTYHFEVRTGAWPENAGNGTKAGGRGANFFCILSGTPITGDYIKSEGMAGRIGLKLIAAVVEAGRGRVYISPTSEMEKVAISANPDWIPPGLIPTKLSGGSCVPYGMREWGDLFTSRQLLGISTLSQQIDLVRQKIITDARLANWSDDNKKLSEHGFGPTAYAEAISMYLAFAVDRCADFSNTCTRWTPGNQKVMNLFAKQSIAMTWDFPEANILADTVGGYFPAAQYIADCLEMLPKKVEIGDAQQADAAQSERSSGKVISTDPPYYDNIFYADLSDFFYVWLRRTLRPIFPDLFGSIMVPKKEELVATPHRHGGRECAEEFFLKGMTSAMNKLADQAHPAFPTTIYYAFKQSETTDLGTGNTGWETFLEAVISAGFAITGTWPMRSEQEFRMVGMGTNALASSIVLVCRKRDSSSPSISRRDFLRELKEDLGDAVEAMIGGAEGISPVAPVDLAQAIIGPGMAIYSKYASVLEANGTPMTVHAALTLINKILTEGGDDFDGDTQFCLGWFDENGWAAGEFGKADVLTRAKGTSVEGIRDAGIVEAGSGKVRLLKPVEYAPDWNTKEDNRTPVWEALHQMIRALQLQGESAAGDLLSRMPERAEPVRNLAYRLYTLCERKGWTDEARGYNDLITSWLGIEAASHEAGHLGSQAKLDI